MAGACGRRFCEFPKVDVLLDDDMLILSRKDGDTYASYSTTYSELKRRALEYVQDRMKLSSMAYENSLDYSRIDHVHGYTHFDYTPTCTSGTVLGTITTSDQSEGNEISVFRPVDPEQPKMIYPYPGQIRYVYSRKRLNGTIRDINDPDFDGWFLANGLCIDWDDITNENMSRYRDNSPFNDTEGEHLVIPKLSSFVRLSPNSNTFYDKEVSFSNAIPQHHHVLSSVEARMDLRVTGKKVSTANQYNAWSDGFVCGGLQGDLSVAKSTVSENVTVNKPNLEIGISGEGQDVETYPTHNTIPTMIYLFGTADYKLSVTFKDEGGTVLKVDAVDIGKDATPPEDTEKTGYVFDGWDRDYRNVRSNLTCVAMYTASKYTITLDDEGGTGGQGTVDVTYGKKVPKLKSLPTPPASLSDEGFSGYYTLSGGQGGRYYDGDGKGLLKYEDTSVSVLHACYGDPIVDIFDSHEDIKEHYGEVSKRFLPGRYKVVAVGAGASYTTSTSKDQWKEYRAQTWSYSNRNDAYWFAMSLGVQYSERTLADGKSRVCVVGGYGGWIGRSTGYTVELYKQKRTENAGYHSIGGGSGAMTTGDIDISSVYKTSISTSLSGNTTIGFENQTVTADCAHKGTGGSASKCSPDSFVSTSGKNGGKKDDVKSYPSVDGGGFASKDYEFGGGMGYRGTSYEPQYGYAHIERYMEVTFEVDGQPYDQKRYCIRNTLCPEPEKPVVYGKTFANWDPDISVAISCDITLSAVFKT